MKFCKLLSLLLIVSNFTLFCGCWNYKDLEKVLLVAGFAIDKNEKGDKYLITVEIVDFEMAGTQAKQVSKLVESEGDTIFDAIRNIINIIGKRLYWAHANVVIISQDIAKEGLSTVVDIMLRDTEIREEMYVVISQEKSAQEIIKQEMLLSQTSSNNIETTLTNQEAVGNAPRIQAYQLIGLLEEEGITVALPAIHLTTNTDKKTAEISGSALFKSDKLVGFLNKDETKSFMFATNKIHGGIITINEDSQNQMDNISLEIYKSKTKMKPEYSDKKLTMNIEIKIDVAIAEIGTSVEYIKKEKLDKLKIDAEEKVKTSVEKVINKVIKEYDSDIFGFGESIKANMPSVWKSAVKNDGNKLFKDMKTNVKVDITIKNSALASKSIKKGD